MDGTINNPNSLPDDVVVDAFKMFVSHFDERKHPQILQGDTLYFENAIHSCVGLASLRGHAGRIEELVSAITREWPKLFKSLRALLDKCLNSKGKGPSEDMNRQLRSLLPSVFILFEKNTELSAKTFSSPQVLEFISRLWVLESSCRVNVDHAYSAAATRALHNCISGSRSPPDTLERFVNGVKGGKEQVADLAFTRFRDAMKEVPIRPSRIADYTFLLYYLTCEYKHPICGALLAKHSVPVVTKAITTLATSDESFSKEDREQIALACATCFGFIRNCCHHSYGWPWFTQAVKFGLLEAFCRSALLFPTMNELDPKALTGAEELFGTLYPKFLVYHSIITCSMEAMKKVASDRLHHLARASLLGKQWETFECLLMERMVRKRLYDHIVSSHVKRTGCCFVRLVMPMLIF